MQEGARTDLEPKTLAASHPGGRRRLLPERWGGGARRRPSAFGTKVAASALIQIKALAGSMTSRWVVQRGGARRSEGAGMTYRSLLVQIDDSRACAGRIAFAGSPLHAAEVRLLGGGADVASHLPVDGWDVHSGAPA